MIAGGWRAFPAARASVLHPGGIAPGRWLSAPLAGGETRPDERPRGDETDHATETGAGTIIPDLDAFEAFFRQHQDAVYGYLLRMTGDEHAAHDLSQETFLRAWQRFDRVRAYDAPRAWLLRVATNLALTHLRRHSLPIGAAHPLDSRDDDESGPARSDPALRIVERDAVLHALLALAPNQRAALVLREVYGLSCEEVGAALGVSRAAAKMLLLRGRDQFRARYDREEDGR
jgi:RNA polymerase sigma factor (sigma-70 family)